MDDIDQHAAQPDDDRDDDLLEEQEGKGYGEDEGEREAALEDE
jgi:hypothetical protein